jgi:glyoxylase-like metal-dependent hydrolase (beta-lactamase superfamily II)
MLKKYATAAFARVCLQIDAACVRPVQDGDGLRVGGVELKFLHTPGHTVGGMCVHIPQYK